MTKNILITGGCGFIGSNFINYFHQLYPECVIVNYDKVDYCSNPDFISNKDKNYILIKSDLNNTHILMTTLKSYQIDTVIHFAAQSHVDNSFGNSIQFTIDNILGTHNLLECCRVYGKIKKFIHISTDEVYGEVDINHEGCSEKSLLNPTNPYAATKAGAEFLVKSYYYSYKLPIIITRGNNVYGPNQYPEKLIPLFIKLLKEDKKATIQGDGSTVRAFLHAHDTARAFECILKNGKIGEIYNIGCDDGLEYSVIEIAKKLIKLIKNTDNYDEWLEYIEDRPYNDKRYYISNKKVKDLGWDIKIKLNDGIYDLVNNY